MDIDPPAAQPVAAPAAEAEPSKAEAPPLTLDNPQVLPAFACTMAVGMRLHLCYRYSNLAVDKHIRLVTNLLSLL